MTDAQPPSHESDATDADQPGDDAGDQHGHDDHGDPSGALGPVDVQAWGAMLLGGALGLIVAVCLAISASGGA